MSPDEYAEKYAAICDVVERSRWGLPLDEQPGEPDFGFTSNVARAAANRIIEILEVPEPELSPDAVPPPDEMPDEARRSYIRTYPSHEGDLARFMRHQIAVAEYRLRTHRAYEAMVADSASRRRRVSAQENEVPED